MPFQSGYDKHSVFKLEKDVPGAGQHVHIDVTYHTWEEWVRDEVVNSTGTGASFDKGALTARLLTYRDGQGMVRGIIDTAVFPWSRVNANGDTGPIRAGMSGLLSLKVGTTDDDYIQVPCSVTRLRVTSEHAGLVEFEFEVKLNAFVYFQDTNAYDYKYPGSHGAEQAPGTVGGP